MRRTLVAGLASFAAIVASAGFAQAQTNIRIGLAEDPDVLDPTLARTYVGRIVFASLCDKLFDIDEKLNLVPQLALSHEISPDGKQVTIKLRPNVKFHDGEPMDAEAVKFSLDRHLTMQGSFRKPELAAVDRVEAVDPTTVRLVLKTPFSPLLAQLTDRAGMIVSPKAAKEAGDRFGQQPVCAGPFKFVERVQQDRIVLEKFADYWDKDRIYIDRVTFLPIADSTVRLANLKAGQLDLIERALATDIKEIRSNASLKLVAITELGYQGMTINIANGEASKGPLGQDARVRQALGLAIDREAINQVVFNGEFVPGNQWVSPENPYYQESLPVPSRDVEKAKELLQEAGVKTPVTVDFMVPNNPEVRAVAEVIQAMAAEAGFDMKIRIVEFATGLKEAEDGRYQAFMLAWSGRTDPDGNVYSFHKTKAPLNYSGYSDAQADAWLDESRVKSDPKERKAIYEKLAQKLLSEGGIQYLYHRKILIAHSNKVEGYKQMPDGLVRLQGVKMK
ncbi:ABC transporter substrate-binding protein [Microvirga massiliensis]|uniref:ABC transporter substrate-binding protein n=1 Tax=Microvirga massiliensis TaxID=1033741 RepID=UPI00062BD8EB|nr:ABC transporter substrate-binding protein [Microvirga massiliensis]